MPKLKYCIVHLSNYHTIDLFAKLSNVLFILGICFSQIHNQLLDGNLNGSVPSKQTIHDIFLNVHRKRESHYEAAMKSLKGTVISVDHTFKVR